MIVSIYGGRRRQESTRKEAVVIMNLSTPGSPYEQKFPDPAMVLRTKGTEGFFRANASFLSQTGFNQEELTKKPFLQWLNPADVEAAELTLQGKQACCEVRHKTRHGEPLSLNMRVVEHKGESIILARCVESVEEASGPQDSDDEATVLGTLHTIAKIVEDQNPGFKCSILLVADGKFVRGAGPSLPEEYNAAVDGYAIGPTVGSCGTAIYWNVPVIVTDIQADPLWADLAVLAKSAGVAACWSFPFASKTGNVLGACALYSPVPCIPTEEQLGRLKAAASMTGLAVERGRAEESLREQRARELVLEEQLRQAAKMEALGVLAGGIAHDFNNVLSTVLANAEFGRELLPEDSVVQEMLSDIVEASKRAGQFCQRMLDYAGRGSIERSTIEIGVLVPEISNLVLASISKKATLEYQLSKQPIHVEGDENQLLQVFMNLVTNAGEAIGENAGRIVVRSTLVEYDQSELELLDPHGELKAGQYVRLSVSDTGPGLDKNLIAQIFDPFFTTKATGHGLGLSAVQGIVKRHGGVILVESEEQKGTTFTVLLPTVEKASAPAGDAVSSIISTEQKCILVADDERALRDILSRKLKHAGFDILEANDGQDAVDVFTEHHESIDCVLLDFSMPRLNGEEVQRAMHAICKDIPIILMSGFSEQEVVDRFKDAGIAGCLQKPVSTGLLVDTIHKVLGKPQD